MHYMKIKFFFIIFSLLFITNSYAYKNYIYNLNKKINITDVQLKRLYNYLEGNSYSSNKKIEKHLSPMVFAISSDGTTSGLIFCNSFKSIDCDLNLNAYQLIMKVKKNSNQNLKIIFIENRFITNQKNIRVTSENISSLIKEEFLITKNKKDNYYQNIIDIRSVVNPTD